ncbi:transposase [Escherichia coli]|nr:transposase [Escherichia coli]
MGSCAAPSAKGDDKFITTDYLQQCLQQFVAVQLNIRRPEVLTRYAERVTTLREHTALIKEYYGYHEFGDFPWSFRLKRLLYTRAWLSNE